MLRAGRDNLDSPLSAFALLLLAGCAGNANSDEADAPGPIEADQAVATLSVATSFLDRGVKGIAFGNGAGFAYKMVDARKRKFGFVSFELSDRERKRLFGAFNRHDFLRLPAQMRSRVYDGTAVTIAVADPQNSHSVYNYMTDNAGFRAVQKVFQELLLDKLERNEPLDPEEFLTAVDKQVESLPEDSSRRKLAGEWLEQAATVMILNGMITAEQVEKLGIKHRVAPANPEPENAVQNSQAPAQKLRRKVRPDSKPREAR